MLQHALIIIKIRVLRASINSIISHHTLDCLSRRNKRCARRCLLLNFLRLQVWRVKCLHQKDLVTHEITVSLLVPSGVHS